MDKIDKPEKLYHGNRQLVEGPLEPVLRHGTLDHIHTKAAVFATARMDLAMLFMYPLDIIHSIGFEGDVAYICIWGKPEDYATRHIVGYLYILPSTSFEKVGKEYEWQSFVPVEPLEVKKIDPVLQGMMECGVQVYFINDEATMDRVVADKNNRAPILRELVSENQKL